MRSLTETGETTVAEENVLKSSQLDLDAPTNASNIDRVTALVLNNLHKDSMAWIKALEETNNPPWLFKRGSSLIRLEKDDAGKPKRLVPLDSAKLIAESTKHIDFVKNNGNTRDPKVATARNILSMSPTDWPFPPLYAIVRNPVFQADGRLLLKEGYDRSSASWLDFGNLNLPRLPDAPTQADLDKAKSILLEDVLVDFPFEDQASRANAVAMLLAPLLRPFINDATPLHLISAPVEGTGKGKLANLVNLVATGEKASVSPVPSNNDEWEKFITANLLNGDTLFLLDNASGLVGSKALAAALTATDWKARILGTSNTASLRNDTTWVITGNNVSTSSEIARRTVYIRLNAGVENPSGRTGFKHKDLEGWVKQQRGEVLWSLLVLVKHWQAQGSPHGRKVMGSYERWAGVMGGILDAAGIPGFLDNRDALRGAVNEEMQELSAFVEAWWSKFGAAKVSASELAKLVSEQSLLPSFSSEQAAGDAAQRMGLFVKKHLDRVVGSFKITFSGKVNNSNQYALQAVAPPESVGEADAGQEHPEGDAEPNTALPEITFTKEDFVMHRELDGAAAEAEASDDTWPYATARPFDAEGYIKTANERLERAGNLPYEVGVYFADLQTAVAAGAGCFESGGGLLVPVYDPNGKVWNAWTPGYPEYEEERYWGDYMAEIEYPYPRLPWYSPENAGAVGDGVLVVARLNPPRALALWSRYQSTRVPLRIVALQRADEGIKAGYLNAIKDVEKYKQVVIVTQDLEEEEIGDLIEHTSNAGKEVRFLPKLSDFYTTEDKTYGASYALQADFNAEVMSHTQSFEEYELDKFMRELEF